MIKVKDLFSEVFDWYYEEFINFYKSLLCNKTISVNHKLEINNAIKEIKSTVPKENYENWTIIPMPIRGYDEIGKLEITYTTTVYKFYEVKNNINEFIDSINKINIDRVIEELDNYDIKQIQKILHNIKYLESYSFMLSDWDEILGFNILESTLTYLDRAKLVALIFYEMTFCGFSTSDIEKERNIIEDRCEEIDNMSEEKLRECTYDIEEISKLFNIEDNRTDEQKELEFKQELLRDLKSTVYNYKAQFEIFTMIQNSSEFQKI